MTTTMRWVSGSAVLLLALASWVASPRPLAADSGLGAHPAPLQTVMASTGMGPQAMVLLDAQERRLSVYTVDPQGRIVFAALRPYLYDLSVPLEYPHPRNALVQDWTALRKALQDHYRKEFEDRGGSFEDFLKGRLKDGVQATQLMTASDVAEKQPQLILVLDAANLKILAYRFTLTAGLELVSVRDIGFDQQAGDCTGRPAYVPVEEVRRRLEEAKRRAR